MTLCRSNSTVLETGTTSLALIDFHIKTSSSFYRRELAIGVSLTFGKPLLQLTIAS